MTRQWKPEIRAHRRFREPLVLTVPTRPDAEVAADVQAQACNLSRTLARPVIVVADGWVIPVVGR